MAAANRYPAAALRCAVGKGEAELVPGLDMGLRLFLRSSSEWQRLPLFRRRCRAASPGIRSELLCRREIGDNVRLDTDGHTDQGSVWSRKFLHQAICPAHGSYAIDRRPLYSKYEQSGYGPLNRCGEQEHDQLL